MASIREQVMSALRTVLASITVGNGYASTVTKVREGELDWDTLTQGGIGVLYADGEESYANNINRLMKGLSVSIVGVIPMSLGAGDEAMGTAGRALLADFEKALMANRTLSGASSDILLERNGMDMGEDLGP